MALGNNIKHARKATGLTQEDIAKENVIIQLKSLRFYILFLVALGYQTEGCVLYKAKNRAEENPLPGRFLVLS